MQLREALESIDVIRQRMTQTEVFRGYRATPVAISAIFAIVAGILQPIFVPNPRENLPGYVAMWSLVAFSSIAITGLAMFLRDRVAGRSLTRQFTWLAIWQFCPSLITAACFTLVIVRLSPATGWILPGIWQLMFSQGVFAACRVLPRLAFGVAVFYAASGIATVCFFRGEDSLSPIAMAIPFGVGQLLAASILYFTLERTDGRR